MVLVLVYITGDHKTLLSNRVSVDTWLALTSRPVVFYGKRTGTIFRTIFHPIKNPKNQNQKNKNKMGWFEHVQSYTLQGDQYISLV